MDKIIKYLIETKKKSPKAAELIAKKLCRYDDIKDEFIFWLENKSLKKEAPVEAEGYTAEKLLEIQPSLEITGAYTFLVSLRDDPEAAKEIIRKGFPRK